MTPRQAATLLPFLTCFPFRFGSVDLLRQAGKTLSGWITKIGDVAIGGQPPSYDDIDTDVDLLRKLEHAIFEDDEKCRWTPKVRELLVMTLLLRYDQFIDILMTHRGAEVVDGLDDNGLPTKVCRVVDDNLF